MTLFPEVGEPQRKEGVSIKLGFSEKGLQATDNCTWGWDYQTAPQTKAKNVFVFSHHSLPDCLVLALEFYRSPANWGSLDIVITGQLGHSKLCS